MNLQHISAKIFAEPNCQVDWAELVREFHRWVAQQSMPEVLIDVADYQHVHDGPGVVLVGLEGDYSLDLTQGRMGLRYCRKAALDGSATELFRQAIQSAVRACQQLEALDIGLRFVRNELELLVNDRALAPNNAETFAVCSAEWPSIFQTVLSSSELQIEYQRDPRSRFGAIVRGTAPLLKI